MLALLRENLTNEQIAERLGVTLHAARYHVSQILSKLGVATREEAAAWQPETARAGPRWSLAFQVWLTAAAAVALIAVGVLAWGVLRGGDDEQAGVITSPSPTSAPSAVESQSPPPTFFPQPRPNVGANVRSMQLVSPDFAWILTDSQLTNTQFVPLGEKIVIQTKDITPPGVAPGDIRGFHFLDSGHGWLVANGASDPSHALQLIAYRTSDGGDTWQSSPLGEPDLINTASAFAPAFIDFLNASTGWVVAKTGSGTNFSVGSLFRTDDGGVTWTKLSIPTGDPVYFTDANNGWAAGGVPFHSKLYVTRDGGATWQDVSDITPLAQLAGARMFGLTQAIDGSSGRTDGGQLILPVTQLIEPGPSLYSLYASSDGGQTWHSLASTDIASNFGVGVTAATQVFDDGSAVAFPPGGAQALLYFPGASEFETFSPSGLGGPVNVSFADSLHGWALVEQDGCASSKEGCWHVQYIERTEDGGHTWSPLPFGSAPTPTQ